jgi:hypothetical protein
MDFAKTQRLCQLRYAKVAEPLHELPKQLNGSPTCGSSRNKQDGECWQFAPLFVRPWHIQAASARYIHAMLFKVREVPVGSRQVVAKSSGSGEPVFT